MTLEIDPRLKRAPRNSQHVCIHHWVIDAADGAESAGRCKHCGEERCFSNSLESDSWSPKRDESALRSIVTVPAQRHVELADER